MNARGPSLTLTRLATRNLVRRPVRTGLTALGVAVGVVAIVAFTSIVRGWWGQADAALHFQDTDLVVFQAHAAADGDALRLPTQMHDDWAEGEPVK